MSFGTNRTLQVRAADRLRAELPRDAEFGLPDVASVSESDRRELCEVGGGRLAAVAVRILVADERLQVLAMREAARLVNDHVRRTDLLGSLDTATLVILAPGLDPIGGRALAERLHALLADRQVELAGVRVELRASVGTAYRSPVSPLGWTPRALAAEAALHASETPSENVA